MSPELALDGQLSAKSDVFSFGILCLEVISGRQNTDINLLGTEMQTLLSWVRPSTLILLSILIIIKSVPYCLTGAPNAHCNEARVPRKTLGMGFLLATLPIAPRKLLDNSVIEAALTLLKSNPHDQMISICIILKVFFSSKNTN